MISHLALAPALSGALIKQTVECLQFRLCRRNPPLAIIDALSAIGNQPLVIGNSAGGLSPWRARAKAF
jgi:hypothetical protein